MSIKTHLIGKLLIEATQCANVDSMNLTVDVGQGETTGIGQGWADVVPLVKRASLQVTCTYDPADTAHGLVRTEFITGDCLMSAIQAWEGLTAHFDMSGAMVTACGVTKSVGGVDKLSFTLVCKGALSYTA